MRKIKIEFSSKNINLFALGPFNERELQKLVNLIVVNAYFSNYDISLICMNDFEISKFNSKFMGVGGPTNVLSFPEDNENAICGEIMMSIPTIVREADLFCQDIYKYTARMLTHAILHLAGYEHGFEMETLTEQIIDKLDM